MTAASGKAPVTVEPAAVATRRAASPKPTRAPKPARRRTQPAIPHAPPHDADRLGLPLAILARTDGAPHDTALLIAAGLLLFACGAGSLTVGITVGRMARGT